MNRATKRLLAKQEAQAEKTRAGAGGPGGGARGPAGGGGARGPGGGGRGFSRAPSAPGEKREGRLRRYRRFFKEVRIELRKVAWPTRGEVVTYTVVVLVSVLFVTLYVFGLDFAFAKGLLNFFKS